MIGSGNEKIVDYFLNELYSLRERAGNFSQDYPAVAAELGLGSGKSDDPHVELLLQAFAYLTGRLRYNLDADLPEVSVNLLKHLYPHLEAPVPCMAVTHAELYPEGADYAGGYLVERGRLLKRSVDASDNKTYECVFRVGYDTLLWPIEIKDMSVAPTNHYGFIQEHYPDCRSVVRVDLASINGAPIGALKMSTLRMFVDHQSAGSYALYDRLRSNMIAVVCAEPNEGEYQNVHPAELEWLGFDDEHALLPYKKSSHQGYRLLQEYFAFPEKFLFFDLHGIECAGSSLEVFFLFDENLSENHEIYNARLQVNCMPVVNLFRNVTDPIRLDQKKFEYLLVPDNKDYRATEIHSIQKVTCTDISGASHEVMPFLPQDHVYGIEQTQSYWSSRRDYSERKYLPGSEMYLSFHNRNFDIALPPGETIFAETLCTNRDVPTNMRVGTDLKIFGQGPLSRIKLHTKPTYPRTPRVRGARPWELVSHLSLNFMSLGGEKENLIAFQTLLRMYTETDDLPHQRLIDGIVDIDVRPSVHHIGDDAWRGFCEGATVVLTIDENKLKETSLFLFGEVIRHFLALYSSANSFVKLSLESKQRRGTIKEWPPLVGDKALL